MASISKYTLSLFLVIIVGFLTQNSQQSFLLSKSRKEINVHDKEVIQYWLGGIKGLWFGFHKEFYHGKKKVDAKCLSSEADKQIFEILYFLSFGEFQDVFEVADDFYKLYTDNTQQCGVQQVVEEVLDMCSASGKNKCGFSNLMQNGQKNLFKLIHSCEALVEVVKGAKFDTSEHFYETTFELGNELAETLVSILGL
eukprot:403356076